MRSLVVLFSFTSALAEAQPGNPISQFAGTWTLIDGPAICAEHFQSEDRNGLSITVLEDPAQITIQDVHSFGGGYHHFNSVELGSLVVDRPNEMEWKYSYSRTETGGTLIIFPIGRIVKRNRVQYLLDKSQILISKRDKYIDYTELFKRTLNDADYVLTLNRDQTLSMKFKLRQKNYQGDITREGSCTFKK